MAHHRMVVDQTKKQIFKERHLCWDHVRYTKLFFYLPDVGHAQPGMERKYHVPDAKCVGTITINHYCGDRIQGKTKSTQLDRDWTGHTVDPDNCLCSERRHLEDHFLTLSSPSEGYYMERGSKFLAYAYPIATEDDVPNILQIIKKEHPKARHYCTALRLFPDGSIERSNDDGEPSGSAGRPILGQLVKNNLTNVCVVVVRYFGGTKLGIPGLIEAYKTSTANALASGSIVERSVLTKVMIKISYESFPTFLNYFKQHDIPVIEEAFGDLASFIICLPKSTLKHKLMEILHQLSQMDYEDLERYTLHLGIEVEVLNEDIII